jgi:hypothetical protein
MADMKPEDLEKLRRLEEEVDRERAEMQKRREELEKKALVPVEDAAETKNAPAKKEEGSKELATDKDANAWKRGMQQKIAIGAGGVMVAYWLMTNLVTIAAMIGVVGGAYYFAGKYLNPEPDDKKKPEEKKS